MSAMADTLDDTRTVALRLLVVEDEALVAMLIEDALLLHGYDVVGIADTAAAAIDMAERERPDLALCDVKLADGDSGTTIAASLAARGIPCLYLSGNCPERGSNNRLIVGCLPKPFHTASIGVAVQAAYEVALGRQPAVMPTGMMLY
jgi:CheY-like chemotaxis protein